MTWAASGICGLLGVCKGKSHGQGRRSSQNWDLCEKWGPLIRAGLVVPWGRGYVVRTVPSTLTSPSACSGRCLERVDDVVQLHTGL